ncbi:MAG: glycosyltransferase [Bdellovibrionales bacterium]|nr:glycosyltransferase [Bdellovibrionales bacterium]
MNNPKTTVYIPCYNYGRFLKEATESVLRQSCDNWELLIIDDASSDNTQDVMNLYKGDSRIRLFTVDGIGLPAVCNFALREARGDYLIRLDADDIFEENILLVLSNYLDRNPECAMVFPDYYLIDENNEIYAHERTQKVFEQNHVFDNAPNGACCLIRKSALEDLGGYREDLGAQDGFDLWRKVLKKYKPGNVNIPLFYYRRHSENLTNQANRIVLARQQLKLENVIDQLDKFRPITAVIPCRRNYDFCEDLWREDIVGKSLLERALEKVTRSSIVDKVIVPSDNPEVKKVLSRYSDERLVYFERKPENTLRSVPLTRTLGRVAESIDFRGIMVIVYLQTPFVTTQTIEEAIYTLILNEADCSVGVEEIREPLYKRAANGLQAINPPKGISTDFDLVYRDVGTALATKTGNLRAGSLYGPRTVKFIVSREQSFVINSDQSLRIAAIMSENAKI